MSLNIHVAIAAYAPLLAPNRAQGDLKVCQTCFRFLGGTIILIVALIMGFSVEA